MKLEIFSSCDAATSSAGKVNLVGVFDTLNLVKLPTTYHAFAVVLRIRADEHDETPHHITLKTIDEDGNELIPAFDGEFKFPPPCNYSSTVNLIMNLNNVKITKYGTYYFKLLIDDEFMDKIPLFVKQKAKNTN